METSWLQQLIAAVLRFFSPASSERNAGEWKTVGPDKGEYPVVTAGDVAHVAEKVNSGEFKEGKWSLATYKEMFAGRIGRAIVPRTLVVHTTDMQPGTFNALVRNWTSQLGRGNGAHFLIGKSEAGGGVIQFAPIHRNGNHAGGSNCGSIGELNPNVCSVGVEIDNAGKLTKNKAGQWTHKESGHVFAPEDVFIDAKGHGWEKVTPYQLQMLERLWTALKPTLKPWSADSIVKPNGSYADNGCLWAKPVKPSLIGHASTNPINKTDPGPQVMEVINSWT